MGFVRKTLSVGTLGLVPFRSKAERLERVELALAEAEAARTAESLARADAEAAAAAARNELRSERTSRRRRRRTAEARTLLASTAAAVEEAGHAVADAARAAEPAIAKGASDVVGAAKHRLDEAKDAITGAVAG